MALFGSSGIRGVVGEEITNRLAMELGQTIGERYRRVVVGRDPRTSGEMLSSALISGLLSTGADVADAGIVSTPTLVHAAREFDCGIVVTASHNPGEYNGFKLWNPSGLAFVEKQRREVEEALGRQKKLAGWREIGSLTHLEGAVRDHIEAIRKEIVSLDLKVVVDCGCGSAATITPFLLQELGCDLVTLNCQLDGRFPGRDPEPTAEGLSVLGSMVVKSSADLGIAHDGDGDRMVAVDEKGRFVGGDLLLPILAMKEAKESIVVPVNSSMVLDDLLKNVKIWRTRVGDVFVGEEIERRNADFGGEPSGTWIFPSFSLCPDGIYAAARLAKIVESEPLSDMVAEIPRYPLLRESLRFEPGRRAEIVERLEKALKDTGWDISTIDGWRVDFGDGWGLVRLSGTEPKIRITSEAREEERAKDIFARLDAIVRKVVG